MRVFLEQEHLRVPDGTLYNIFVLSNFPGMFTGRVIGNTMLTWTTYHVFQMGTPKQAVKNVIQGESKLQRK